MIDYAVLRDIVVFCVGSPGSKRTTRDWQSDALATELTGLIFSLKLLVPSFIYMAAKYVVRWNVKVAGQVLIALRCANPLSMRHSVLSRGKA